MKKWLCIICGLIYDEAKGWPGDGIAAGTRWEDVPDDWLCPDCGVAKSDFEMIELAQQAVEVEGVAPIKELPIVIVGTGYAGYTLAESIRQRSKSQQIVLFTTDDGANYSKPSLSNALSRDKEADQLISESVLEIEQRLNVRVYARCKVDSIDTENKQLHTDFGVQGYRKLVLAQGAAPRRLALEGAAAKEIISVNNLNDYRKFREKLLISKHVTIIGSGLIGCEFANDLSSKGYAVTVVGHADWPMNRLLPQQIGEKLQSNLSDQGVLWHHQNTVECIEKSQSGYCLTLRDGIVIETDLVLSAIGLAPRTTLAKTAGVSCNQGIVVNGGLRTNVNDIYALGDCAEIQGQLLPYIAPINVAQRALADCLMARPTMAQYPLMPVIVKTPALPLSLLVPALGKEGAWQVESMDEGLRGLYYSVDGELLGFALAGDTVSERQQWIDKAVK